MPVSPAKKTDQQPEGSTAKKGKNHQTTSRRNRNKKIKASYAKAREDAQLAGVIPTEPVGAVRDERVDPRTQGCQQLPARVREALRQNWSTPDEAKPGVVGALLEPFFAQDTFLDKDGNQVKVPPNRGLLIELAKTLRMLDQTQFERDHPEQAAKAKGGTTSVSVQTNLTAIDLLNQYDQTGSRAPGTALAVAGAPGDGGQQPEVEAGAAPAPHQ